MAVVASETVGVRGLSEEREGGRRPWKLCRERKLDEGLARRLDEVLAERSGPWELLCMERRLDVEVLVERSGLPARPRKRRGSGVSGRVWDGEAGPCHGEDGRRPPGDQAITARRAWSCHLRSSLALRSRRSSGSSSPTLRLLSLVSSGGAAAVAGSGGGEEEGARLGVGVSGVGVGGLAGRTATGLWRLRLVGRIAAGLRSAKTAEVRCTPSDTAGSQWAGASPSHARDSSSLGWITTRPG